MNQKAAMIALAVLTVIWSFNWVLMKGVLVYIDPFSFSALRCLLGAAVVFLVLYWRQESLRLPPWRWTLSIALLQTVGMMGLAQWALLAGGAGKVAMLVYVMPFWVIILACLFLGERPHFFQAIAIGLALFGVLFLLQPWQLSTDYMAMILSLLSGFCWAASAVVAKRFYRYYQVNLLTLTAWQMLLGGSVLSVIALLLPSSPIDWQLNLGLILLYNAVLATALAWALWLFILKRLPASIASLSTLLIPVLGVFFSWWILHEVPNNYDLLGMCLIILALCLQSIPKEHWQNWRSRYFVTKAE